jgi:hypothetical protein
MIAPEWPRANANNNRRQRAATNYRRTFMKKHTVYSVLFIFLLGAVSLLAGCQSDATVASQNLSRAADMFEIDRRIVFFNGITDTYLLTVEGRCSVEVDQLGKLDVTCKTGPNSFKKHFLGLSDNVSWFAEQIDGADVSVYRYRVIFKPETIIPNIDLETSARR